MQLPTSLPGILLVLGAVFLLIAVVGGGFEVAALRLPPIGRAQRVGALLAGITLIALGVIPAREDRPGQTVPTTVTADVGTKAAAPAPGPAAAPAPAVSSSQSAKPQAKAPPKPPTRPELILKFFSDTSTEAQHPEARVTVPAGYKIISGGARVDWTEPGNLLTASYPEGTSAWVARSKDHQQPSPAHIEAWAVALRDPKNEWDVRVVSAKSSPAPHPTASVTVPDGYTMTGGGAEANWEHEGSLLTASFPHGTGTWEARSKDHLVAEVTTLTVFAIGIRPRNGAVFPASAVFSQRSGSENHPHATAEVPANYILVGGGALVDWKGSGNLLTASYPDDQGGWTVASKDHIAADPAVIVAYALGVLR
jgi:hypothetical protein